MTPRRHRDRRDRLRNLLAGEAPGSALLVTSLPNVQYLTGFSGSNAVLVVAPDPDADLLGTDGRYVDQAAAEAPGLPTVIDRATLPAVLDASGGVGLVVEDGLTLAEAAVMRQSGREPVVVSGLVERLRAVKDDDEIAHLEQACTITAAAMSALADEMRPGAREVDLARRLEQLFAELGADDRAFDTIVGSGPHSAIPHHQPGHRALEPGDLVVVDAGARVAGYHADMTRTFLVAAEPADWQARIHEVVETAQAAAADAYRPGAELRALDEVARGARAAAAPGDRFTHGLGHGVGLQIHEAPMVGARSTGTICASMVITVEPGVYLPGRGGVRIEDTLVVTDAGPRVLTEAPRGLRVVG
jgi:Xaa-Pro dipeptidase